MEELICLVMIIGMMSLILLQIKYDPGMNYNKDYNNDYEADYIKSSLVITYESDIPDKRERIVELLILLNRIEDTDSFLERYDHIREYIFSMT